MQCSLRDKIGVSLEFSLVSSQSLKKREAEKMFKAVSSSFIEPNYSGKKCKARKEKSLVTLVTQLKIGVILVGVVDQVPSLPKPH